eukprot:COSAG01_NODE_906_length_12834_cov_53.626620_9_plen_46_part_00
MYVKAILLIHSSCCGRILFRWVPKLEMLNQRELKRHLESFSSARN